MRLTRQTNYAIRMLMSCAANGARLSRVREIAAAYAVSELFLFKILQPLVEAGLVETVRGRSGGVRLARPAGEITLRAVVEATEESLALSERFETGPVDCPLADGRAARRVARGPRRVSGGARPPHGCQPCGGIELDRRPPRAGA